MINPERLTVTRTRLSDGMVRLTVERWPRVVMLDALFLQSIDLELASIDGDEVTFLVANGRATYHLAHDEFSLAHMASPAYLISSRFTLEEEQP